MCNKLETQFDGFPLGISEESKQWAFQKVTSILAHPKAKTGFQLYEIVDLFFSREDPTLPEDFKNAVLQDWRYLTVERACRRVAQNVWRL